MSVEFFQTIMGKRFYEGTMPQIATSLAKIAKQMENESEGIETSQFKDPYIRLDIPDSTLFVQVKLDDEGVSVDIFDHNSPSPDAKVGTWKLYQEMADGE